MGDRGQAGEPALEVELSWPASQPGDRPASRATGTPPRQDPGVADVAAVHAPPDVTLRRVVEAIEELRSDVRGLRAAVAELREGVERSSVVGGAEPAVAEELALLRRELVALRRRFKLRAGPDV